MIRVRLIHRSTRRFIEAQWEDPVTGLKKTRSTGTAIRREAERFAAKLENEISDGKARRVIRADWKQATELYAAEVFPGIARATATNMRCCWSEIVRVVNPARPAALREDQIADVIATLRRKGRSPYTIRKHLSKIRQFLRWCLDRRLIESLPALPKPPRDVAPTRSRPVTREEVERMQAACQAIVGRKHARHWSRLIDGLWLSGLRLGEALSLHWTDDTAICVELDHARPMFRIQAKGEKSRQFRLLPMVPEFCQFLSKTPKAARHGFIFDLPSMRKGGSRPGLDWVSKRLVEIGEKSGVKVASKNGKPAFVKAHDLRRAFGFRWAMKVRAPILMLLMRHKNITTTLQFYVGQDSQAAADEVWRASGNTFANTAHSDTAPASQDQQKTA